MDHVSAYNSLTLCELDKLSPKNKYSPESVKLLKTLSTLNKASPLPSKQFRASIVLKALSNHFKTCWEYEKSHSPKLSFYHTIKQKFAKEHYLDTIKNATHRHRTTKTRISAHDFEIEKGRYSNIPRDERFCKWCLLSMNVHIIEDEKHVLFQCDLHSKARYKFINDLSKAPSDTEIGRQLALNITLNTPESYLMHLISPNVQSINELDHDKFIQHHKIPMNKNNPEYEPLVNLRSHICNTACAFINRCFENRKIFIKDSLNSKFKSLTILITR